MRQMPKHFYTNEFSMIGLNSKLNKQICFKIELCEVIWTKNCFEFTLKRFIAQTYFMFAFDKTSIKKTSEISTNLSFDSWCFRLERVDTLKLFIKLTFFFDCTFIIVLYTLILQLVFESALLFGSILLYFRN